MRRDDPHPTMGIDIGQKRDPTAICVATLENRWADERLVRHYLIRHLERMPLGTPYPEVARRVGEVAAGVQTRTGRTQLWTYVDATGVGTPVVDLIREVAPHVKPLFPVYFTHGDRRSEERSGGWYRVILGKAFLVSRIQALFQSGRVHLPQTEESGALVEELLDYEIRVDENANDRYGAFRVGAHDDLVTALGLALQKDPPPPYWA